MAYRKQLSLIILAFSLSLTASTRADNEFNAIEALNEQSENATSQLTAQAEAGNAEAQTKLAQQILFSGIFNSATTDKDKIEQGMAWYRRAAEQGHIPAQIALSNHAIDGVFKELDWLEAYYWIHKAAEAGDASSQHVLALMYLNEAPFNDKGLPYDLAKGRSFLKLSADQGYDAAELLYGLVDYLGLYEAEEAPANAVQVWQKALESGDENGQFNYWLGRAYLEGKGVDKDMDKARYHMIESAQRGYQLAIDLLNPSNG